MAIASAQRQWITDGKCPNPVVRTNPIVPAQGQWGNAIQESWLRHWHKKYFERRKNRDETKFGNLYQVKVEIFRFHVLPLFEVVVSTVSWNARLSDMDFIEW